jgi:hypothetical protein
MQVRPFGLPDTSEFHLYAESIRIGGLAGNPEELSSNPEGRYSKKHCNNCPRAAKDDGKLKSTDTKTYKGR